MWNKLKQSISWDALYIGSQAYSEILAAMGTISVPIFNEEYLAIERILSSNVASHDSIQACAQEPASHTNLKAKSKVFSVLNLD